MGVQTTTWQYWLPAPYAVTYAWQRDGEPIDVELVANRARFDGAPAVLGVIPQVTSSELGPKSDDRARDMYVPDDPRHAHDIVYFLGVQAEWWFNSSTYR